MSTHHGQLHIHQRKRQYSKKEKFPNPDQTIRLLDNVCIVVSVLMPMTALPQVYKIFATQTVEGLSLIMWVSYMIATTPFLLYGIVHKEKPIILLNALWLFMQSIIITGIITYS